MAATTYIQIAEFLERARQAGAPTTEIDDGIQMGNTFFRADRHGVYSNGWRLLTSEANDIIEGCAP